MIAALLSLVGGSMLAAGSVMVVRGRQGRAQLKSELAEQRITFPDREALPDHLCEFAGRPVDSGSRAKAYSDLIKTHLEQATQGRTYAEITQELQESKGQDEKLVKLRETAFVGQTLRASLMSAYQAAHLTTLVVGLGALFTGLGASLLAVAWGYRPSRRAHG